MIPPPPTGSEPPVQFEPQDGGGGTTNQPPTIEFTATPVGNGVYVLSGQVTDEFPGGLTVSFSGVPSVQGLSTVTNEDGTFSLTVTLRTDGTDFGTITATVTDGGGLTDEDFDFVTP